MGRRYAGWFIRYTEHAQRVGDAIRRSPLPSIPIPKKANLNTAAKENGVASVVGGETPAAIGTAGGATGATTTAKEVKAAWGKAA